MQNNLDLQALFDDCFYASHQTRLRGGAAEPLYRPAREPEDINIVYYRENYVNSALHEMAHWCLAGIERRRLEDYGYWYRPDDRSEDAQKEFEWVELKPQAIEWHLALACGVSFQVSLDNLTGMEHRRVAFTEAVSRQAKLYCENGLPERAAILHQRLAVCFGGKRIPRVGDFDGQ